MKYYLDTIFLGENICYDLINECFILPSEKENLLCSDFEAINTQELMKKKDAARRPDCKECEIYPTCLRGCLNKNIKPLDCCIKCKTILSRIYRLYIKSKMDNDVSFKILNNEIEWLESIGCLIQYQDGGIKIKRDDLQTEDFNFFVGSSKGEKCIRLSQMMPNFEKEEERLLSMKYEKETVYDINYFFRVME